VKTRFKDSDKPLLPYLHGNAAAMAGEEHPVFFLRGILRGYDLSSILLRYCVFASKVATFSHESCHPAAAKLPPLSSL
jgi:hypothetical protein